MNNDIIKRAEEELALMKSAVKGFGYLHIDEGKEKQLTSLISTMLSALKEREWQPIETCPKTGEQFLVSDGEFIIMGEYPNDELETHDITACGMRKAKYWLPLYALPPLPTGKEADNE